MKTINITVSLCMIVKDEEQNLKRCLNAIHKYVDQIVIVDTGSVDNTKQVAAQYTSDIYEYKWNNNFSVPRNISIEKAKADWIFCIDADEEITKESASKLKQTLQKADQLGYQTALVELRDLDFDRSIKCSYFHTRIWKRSPEVSFVNAIHEAPTVIQPYFKSFIKINHYGYTSVSQDVKDKKKIRNLLIFEQEYKKNPRDTRLGWKFAREYCTINEFEKAFKIITATIAEYKRKNPNSKIPIIMHDILIRAEMGLKQTDKALKALDTALEQHPDYFKFDLLKQKIHYENRNYDQAITYFTSYYKKIMLYKSGKILQNELSLSGIYEAPGAMQVMIISCLYTKKIDDCIKWVQVLYSENQQKAISILEKIANSIPKEQLFQLVKDLINIQKSEFLLGFVIALAQSLQPESIEFMRYLKKELDIWK